jgi:hypothetical protein
MNQPQAHAVKPGTPAPPPPPPVVPGPVVVKVPWYKRAWNKIKGWFRSAKDNTVVAYRVVKHYVVFGFDYLVTRIKLLVLSIVNGVWYVLTWLVGLPMRIISFFVVNNSHRLAMDDVQEKQEERAVKHYNREARRAEVRAARAASRRAATLAQQQRPRHASARA